MVLCVLGFQGPLWCCVYFINTGVPGPSVVLCVLGFQGPPWCCVYWGSRALCGAVCTGVPGPYVVLCVLGFQGPMWCCVYYIICTSWSIVKLLNIFALFKLLICFYNITIIFALMVLIVTVLVTTITNLYDFTYDLTI